MTDLRGRFAGYGGLGPSDRVGEHSSYRLGPRSRGQYHRARDPHRKPPVTSPASHSPNNTPPGPLTGQAICQRPRSITITHTGPVFRVEQCEVVDRTGRVARRDIVRHPGAVTVIPVLDDGRLVVIRNERLAVAERLLEFCAGKLEPGEDPAAAAGRELEEECGFRASRVELLGMFYTSPGFADERMFVFLASGLQPVERRLEPGEEIDVETCTLEELLGRVAAGEVRDGKTLGAIMLWQSRTGHRPAV